MNALFDPNPEPTSLEGLIKEINETRQDLINAGYRIATEDEWADVLAAAAEIEQRGWHAS